MLPLNSGVTIVDPPLLKEYRTTGVHYSQPLSAQAQRNHSKQEKLTPVVIDNICISFI